MAKSEKVELRIEPGLKARAKVAAGDVSLSRWVTRLIEREVRWAPEDAVLDAPGVAEQVQAAVDDYAARRSEIAVGLEPLPFRCPDRSCVWAGARVGSARCPAHGRRVVPR